MKIIHLSSRNVVFIILSLIANNIRISNMANNQMEAYSKDQAQKGTTTASSMLFYPRNNTDLILRECPVNAECPELGFPCIVCDMKHNCLYGEMLNATCRALPQVTCTGKREFERQYRCRYCYQTEHWEHKCIQKANCNSVASPRQYYRTNCTVNGDIVCLGHRKFPKRILCSWTAGTRWSTALILALTLGGFGADRFYLGHWQEGIGKLFSFGGLGVWTLVDTLLIGIHHLGPADGSLYI